MFNTGFIVSGFFEFPYVKCVAVNVHFYIVIVDIAKPPNAILEWRYITSLFRN